MSWPSFSHTNPFFFLARSVLHLKHRALLRPTLPAIIQPRGGNVGMPQPLLHTRQSRTSVQHVSCQSMLHTHARGFSLERSTAAVPHSPPWRSARGSRAPGPSARVPGAAGRLHFVKQIGQHELQALLRSVRIEEPRSRRHAAQQGIAVLWRKAKPADLVPRADPQRRH